MKLARWWRVCAPPTRQCVVLALLFLAVLYAAGVAAPRFVSSPASLILTPTFSRPSGYYADGLWLTLTVPDPTATIYFTLDGRVPTSGVGVRYREPLYFDATPRVVVIRARAVGHSGEVGSVVTASYFIAISAELPLFSLVVAPDDLWDVERGIYANYEARGIEWERLADVTYVDRDRQLGFQVPAGVRIHGQWSRQFDKKSLRLYFREEYGVQRLVYPLFSGSDVHTFKRLVLHAGGQDVQDALTRDNWTLFRNQLTANLALKMGGYATHSQPALLFLNGELWGIYQIRERPDARFLADRYGIEAADFCTEPNHPWTRDVIAGDIMHWENLLAFVETHDLADEMHYAYVASQVDIANFIDYNLLQIYTANDDWPQNNVHQFRSREPGGRWRWLFWDSDHGLGGNRDSDFNMLAWALDQQFPLGTERDILLLQKLLENVRFRQQFFSRAVDLLNTTLSPQAVDAEIDVLADELAPDMYYENVRWSSTSNWIANVAALHAFAHERPDVVRDHFVAYFDLAGTSQLTLLPPAEGIGTVAVDGEVRGALPWDGIYFQAVPVHLTAVPARDYRFAGWEPVTLPQTPSITVTVVPSLRVAPRFEQRDAAEPRPGDVTIVDVTDAVLTLRVERRAGVDLRGWRITDNDVKTATDEGSLILADDAALARVPRGTEIVVDLDGTTDGGCPPDDVHTGDRRMVLYTCNRLIDVARDPGFHLGDDASVEDDNVVLLAPGPTAAFGDDQGIDFVGSNPAVTPALFGVLVDGVVGNRDF